MDDDPAKPLSDLMSPGTTLMVAVTPGTDFRPLTVARVDGDRIDILLDTNEAWVAALSEGAPAAVTLSDNRENVWASLLATLSISNDPAEIDELWNPFADSYFDEGRDTPGIAVLHVDIEDGRYWTTPAGRLGSMVSVLKAKFGDAEQSGEHGDVQV